MSRKHYSSSRKLVLAAAVVLAASSAAIADDTSTNRFGGDGYAYFSQPARVNTAVNANWRQSHPNGLSERDLQAASSSSLAASASRPDNPNSLLAGASANPSWRQSHPNGLTERELQAAAASSLAMWQLPNGMGAGSAESNVAQTPSRATSSSAATS